MEYGYGGSERQQDLNTNQAQTNASWTATTAEYFGGDLMLEYTYTSGGTQPSGTTPTRTLLDPEGTVGIVTDGSGNVVSYEQADLYGTNPTSNGSADASEFQQYSCQRQPADWRRCRVHRPSPSERPVVCAMILVAVQACCGLVSRYPSGADRPEVAAHL